MWGYAYLTAAHILNKTPSKAFDKTPYEIWVGRVPKLSFLRVWGCQAYVKRLQPEKLEPRSDKVFFVGYPKETKGYYFYNQSENKVFMARNGVVLESQYFLKSQVGEMFILRSSRRSATNYFSSGSSGDMDEPTTYKAAMAYSEKWFIAMKSEMESMYDKKFGT
ncbi:UNVERIFIED_CONTAM: putative mitochondrial protein [Sesamum latifolium]|uniref:Mitochondrial protein n=1 Tax=Sesamum latifolium TaxID=2727402 RepID=A0AAW2S201_9LAMI